MSKFFSIPNLKSTIVTEVVEPWKIEVAAPFDLPKSEYREWTMNPTVEHHFLSLVEGVIGGLRVDGASNPPWQMYGIMADYDAESPKNAIEHMLKKAPAEFLPQWYGETKSHYSRLVWFFEKPIRLYSADHYEKLVRHMHQHLKFDRWLPGLDTKALTNPAQYYDIGRAWTPVRPEKRIPSVILHLWDSEVFHKVQRQGDAMLRVKIPMEDIKKEVEARFPGRFQGQFVVGARGPRFWDPSADNPSGICVMEDGCRVYTPHDRPFMPWASIFGMDFVQKYEAEKLSSLTDLCAYDGKDFWLSGNVTNAKKWEKWGKDDFRKLLRERGFSDKRVKDSTSLLSEAERVEIQIMVQHRVDAGLPFLFFPQGIIEWNGLRYLNTTSVFPVEPMAPVGPFRPTWAEAAPGFPFIHRVLSRMFVDAEDAPEDRFASVMTAPNEQLTYFLSWLSHFYKSALRKTPAPGQAIVLAGAPSKGKTILTQCILGQLMGGFVDGAPFLVEDDQWSEDIVKAPIVYVDDSVAATDPAAHRRFTARTKKLVANGSIRSNGKFKATGTVPWNGRILILCNLDSESLRILPDVEMSNRDKLSMLRAGTAVTGFGTQEENQRKVAQELPAFARFLLEWEIPEHMVCPKNRFGTVSYMHPSLLREAATQGSEAMFLEGWAATVGGMSQEIWDKYHGRFTGTALEIHNLMSAAAPAVMRELSIRAVGRVLSAMVARGYDITLGVNKAHLRTYSLPRILTVSEKEGLQK